MLIYPEKCPRFEGIIERVYIQVFCWNYGEILVHLLFAFCFLVGGWSSICFKSLLIHFRVSCPQKKREKINVVYILKLVEGLDLHSNYCFTG